MTIKPETRTTAINAAVWVTCSPHEWVWTHDQQVAMARFCCWANRELDDLDLFHWMTRMGLSVSENSAVGFTDYRWAVLDVDNETVGVGKTPIEALKAAREAVEG